MSDNEAPAPEAARGLSVSLEHGGVSDPAGESLGLAEIVAFGHVAWGDLTGPSPATVEKRTRP